MLKILKKRFGPQKITKPLPKSQAKPDDLGAQSEGEDLYIPKLVMHSFGGSKEIAESLAKLTGAEIYFSFCQIRSEVE